MVGGLKVSVWFGERDRTGTHTSAEAIARVLVACGIGTAVLVRAIEGFGSRGEILTDRMLTLSEDLPLVWTATDTPDRVTALAEQVAELIPQGLVTLERCGIAHGPRPSALPDGEDLKLTVTVGRGRRDGGSLVTHRTVDALRAAGADAAWVTLGVDGVLHGVRHRARLIGTNAAVPAQVVAIGSRAAIARGLAALEHQDLPTAHVTLERVRLVKQGGRARAPIADPDATSADAGTWQMLTLVTREDAMIDGTALHVAMLRAARAAGMRGGTAIAGVWGSTDDGPPHGDSMRRLRRGIPVACVLIDTPEAISRFWPDVDALTARTGLVVSERVPAFRAHGPAGTHGRLHLGRRGESGAAD